MNDPSAMQTGLPFFGVDTRFGSVDVKIVSTSIVYMYCAFRINPWPASKIPLFY